MDTNKSNRYKDYFIAGKMTILIAVAIGCAYQAASDRHALQTLRDENAVLNQHMGRLESSLQRIRKYTKSADALANAEMRPGELMQLKPLLSTDVASPSEAVLGHMTFAAKALRQSEALTPADPDLERFTRTLAAVDGLSRETDVVVRRLSNLAIVLKYNKDLMREIPSDMPVHGRVTSEFGERLSPFEGLKRMHEGLDIEAEVGTRVQSPADGVVTYVGNFQHFGLTVVINHGGSHILTRYGHLSSASVRVGDRVQRGSVIARTGNSGRTTGPHLHYEVWVNDHAANPREFFFDLSDSEPLTAKISAVDGKRIDRQMASAVASSSDGI
jgi:murein DD-endopeptidase MepM/ murein hydrolase activator NlpD